MNRDGWVYKLKTNEIDGKWSIWLIAYDMNDLIDGAHPMSLGKKVPKTYIARLPVTPDFEPWPEMAALPETIQVPNLDLYEVRNY